MPSNTFLGRFPNDARAAEFARELSAIVRPYGTIWRRGRGPRKAPALSAGYGPRGFDQSIPLAYAADVAVYFRPKR